MGSTAPSRSTYRFHQPLRSETKWSWSDGLNEGWKIDSSGPPATRRRPRSWAPSASSATHSSVPSQGIRGWPQLVQASRRPSELRRGKAKNAAPPTRMRGGDEPSAGRATISLMGSRPVTWRSRTQMTQFPSGVTTPSA